MAKNIAELNAKCPQCTSKETMIPRVDIKAASNVTVLQCIDCDWEFAKDQSVKIHGNLVRQAAEAMYLAEGYSSLGEYVRDCVRRRNEHINASTFIGEQQEVFTNFINQVAEDPKLFSKMLENADDEV
jgi:hypothetical protein